MQRLIVSLLVSAAAVLVAGPARAFDCAKASTPVEKAICADPKLLGQDAALEKAFAGLKAQKRGAEIGLFVANQREWIAQREIDCRDDGTGKAGTLQACIGAGMDKRLRFLTGQPEGGVGAGSPLWPVFSREKGGEADSENTSLTFAPPKGEAQIRFNAAITAFVSKSLNGSQDNFTAAYVYGSPRLVSVHFEGDWEGSAHPMPWQGDVNFDLAKAKVFKFADAFPASALAGLLAECRKQVAEDIASDDAAVTADREDTLKRVVGDLDRWSFGAKEAVIGFPHGEINDYADGADPECRFPAARINALTNADFPKF